jgi:hypothetical protein
MSTRAFVLGATIFWFKIPYEGAQIFNFTPGACYTGAQNFDFTPGA